MCHACVCASMSVDVCMEHVPCTMCMWSCVCMYMCHQH